MHEELTIAKALEIAITLTKAENVWLKADVQNMFMHKELYENFITVLRFIKGSASKNIRVNNIEFIYANERTNAKQVNF